MACIVVLYTVICIVEKEVHVAQGFDALGVYQLIVILN